MSLSTTCLVCLLLWLTIVVGSCGVHAVQILPRKDVIRSGAAREHSLTTATRKAVESSSEILWRSLIEWKEGFLSAGRAIGILPEKVSVKDQLKAQLESMRGKKEGAPADWRVASRGSRESKMNDRLLSSRSLMDGRVSSRATSTSAWQDCGVGIVVTPAVYYFECNGTEVTWDVFIDYYGSTYTNCSYSIVSNLTCLCPVGLSAESACSDYLPYTCETVRTAPPAVCQTLPTTNHDNLLDSDPVCYNVTLADTLVFEFVLNCAFDEVVVPTLDQLSSFTYFAFVGGPNLDDGSATVTFALYEAPAMNFKRKLWNFRRWSDDRGQRVSSPTAAQWEGSAPFTFELVLADVPNDFYAGGRIYIEAGLDHLQFQSFVGVEETSEGPTTGGLARIVTQRTFVDVQEKAMKAEDVKTLAGWAIALIVIACVIAVVVLVGGSGFAYVKLKDKKD